jgi:hypothetical protein
VKLTTLPSSAESSNEPTFIYTWPYACTTCRDKFIIQTYAVFLSIFRPERPKHFISLTRVLRNLPINCPPFAYHKKTVSVYFIPLPSMYNAMYCSPFWPHHLDEGYKLQRRILTVNLTVTHLDRKFSAFYGTTSFMMLQSLS